MPQIRRFQEHRLCLKFLFGIFNPITLYFTALPNFARPAGLARGSSARRHSPSAWAPARLSLGKFGTWLRRSIPDASKAVCSLRDVNKYASQFTYAPGRTRTHNPRVRSQVLYPLSYGRIRSIITGSEGKTKKVFHLMRFDRANQLYCIQLYNWQRGKTKKVFHLMRFDRANQLYCIQLYNWQRGKNEEGIPPYAL